MRVMRHEKVGGGETFKDWRRKLGEVGEEKGEVGEVGEEDSATSATKTRSWMRVQHPRPRPPARRRGTSPALMRCVRTMRRVTSRWAG